MVEYATLYRDSLAPYNSTTEGRADQTNDLTRRS